MAEQIQIAMIGAGAMANRVHYPSLASFDDVNFAGICDLDSQRLNETANKYEIEGRFQDYRKMIEATAPDAVYAIGPPHIMYDIWAWCLSEGLNIFIEKPMGITIHQARALAYLANQHDCITQVSFQRRSCPMIVQLRDECLQHGSINHAVCTFYKHATAPFLLARDHMMDDGVHAIDTLRWMCGGEVVEVQSLTKRIAVPDINYIAAILHFDTGATGIMMNNWASGRRIFRVEMHAAGICVEAEHEDKGIVYVDGDTQGKVYDTRAVAGSDELYIYGGFQAKTREFIDALKSGQQPASNFNDALKTMEIAETILAKAHLSDHLRR